MKKYSVWVKVELEEESTELAIIQVIHYLDTLKWPYSFNILRDLMRDFYLELKK